MRSLGLRLLIAIAVGFIVPCVVIFALWTSVLSVFAAGTKGIYVVWAIFLLIGVGSPLLGVAASVPAIRLLGGRFLATLLGSYGGFALAAAYAWWTHSHSMRMEVESWLIAILIVTIGAASGAFIGATWPSKRRSDLASVGVLLLIVGSAAVMHARSGMRDARYIRVTTPRESATEQPPEPPPRILWRTESDFEAPLLASAPGGQIYRGESYALASILPNGKTEWTSETDSKSDRAYSFASVAEDGTIYAALGHELESHFSDGPAQWQIDLGDRIRSIALGPDQTVYACVGDYRTAALVAIGPDGHEKWRSTYTGQFGSTAVAADGTIYVSGSTLRAFSPDGSLRWEAKTTIKHSLNALAIGKDGTIYAEAAFEGLRAFSPDGRELWSFDGQGYSRVRTGTSFTPLVAADGTIYAASDNLYALSAQGNLLWAWRPERPIPPGRAVILGDGTIVVASERGVLYAVTPQGKLRWQYAEKPPERVEPNPVRELTVAADGSLRVHYQSSIIAFENTNGPLPANAWPLPRHDPWNTGRAGTAYAIGERPKGGIPPSLRRAVADLGSDTQQTRVAAIETLAKRQIGPSNEIIDALIGAAKHPDPITRARSITTLGKANSPRAVPAIIAALDDSDPDVRLAAATVAAKNNAGHGALNRIIALLHDPALMSSAKNRSKIVTAIGEFGHSAMMSGAIPELQRIRKDDPDANVRALANFALAMICGGTGQPC